MAEKEIRHCKICGKWDDRFSYALVEGKVAVVCLTCKPLTQKKKRQRNGF